MGSSAQRRFVDWEERFVAHDRGSRVVHYYLRDRQGHQCLAVIGTERSLRHMVYVVCDDFIPLAGLDQATTSAFKWRARREVVDWLSAFLIRTRTSEAALSTGSPNNGINLSTDADSSYSLEDGLEGGQEECRSLHHDDDQRKQCSISKADVVWVGSPWSCRKRLRHFNSFQRNGITISVQNFVYVMTEEKDRHIAYVEDLFEDKKLRKKLRVRWFHKTSELTCKIPPPVPHVREVFYTTFQQDLSVECVDGVATVLAPEHYGVRLSTLPADAFAQALVCYRQFDSEGIKSFSIQEVKGYWRQPILSLAGITVSRDISPQSDQGSEDIEMDEEEVDLTRLIRRSRTARCSRRCTGLGNKMSSLSSGDGVGDGSCMSGEAVGSGSGDPPRCRERTHGPSSDQELWRYDVGDHVEVLSEDSGLRGCWFKGTVVRRALRRVKVRYDDVTCEDGKGNLEEWISSCKVSGSCKMGIRLKGRPSIRPCPPKSTGPLRLTEGDVVDAWWNDGWWEGIIRRAEASGFVHVLMLGETETAMLKVIELRESKEWMNGTWAAIRSYPHVVMLFGLYAVQEGMQGGKQMEHGSQQIVKHGSEEGQGLVEDRRLSLVRGLRNADVEAVDQSHTGHDGNASTKACGSSEKEEARVALVGSHCEQDKQKSPSQSATPRSPRSDGHTPMRVVFCQLQQDPHDCTSSDGKQQGVMESGVTTKRYGIGLKWKAGRKRHRQVELNTARVDSYSAHSINDVKNCSMDTVKEEGSSDGDNVESPPLVEAENHPRWKNGECEEIVKHKKHRKGNDSNLKTLHGTPIGNSFIGSLPIANLVMSR